MQITGNQNCGGKGECESIGEGRHEDIVGPHGMGAGNERKEKLSSVKKATRS